jgi:hypothetical protein
MCQHLKSWLSLCASRVWIIVARRVTFLPTIKLTRDECSVLVFWGVVWDAREFTEITTLGENGGGVWRGWRTTV